MQQMGYSRSAYLPRRAKEIILFLFVLVIGLFVILSSYKLLWPSVIKSLDSPARAQFFDRLYLNLGPQVIKNTSLPQLNTFIYKYGIIFDAGSTGTRIYVFKLRQQNLEFIVEDSLYRSIKPGLSSYADNPEQGAKTLIPMLESAQKYIPKQQWQDTPMALKATAGLRLLPQGVAEKLLNAVTSVLLEYPFKAVKNVAQIIDGRDEGVYCWITLNYLLGAFNNQSDFYGSIDLGGGSIQITFLRQSQDIGTENYTTTVDLFGRKYHVYSRSYLGLGLKSATHEILGGLATNSGSLLETPCLLKTTNLSWSHANKDYLVSGTTLAQKNDRSSSCKEEVISVIRKHRVQKFPGFKGRKFCALSYFTDKANEIKIISPEGGEAKIEDFERGANKECMTSSQSSFLCLELTYMSSLLEYGFGFHKNDTTLFIKKIAGYEISWALGAMFDMLSMDNKNGHNS